MPSGPLLVLGIVVAAIVALLVVGSAYLAMRDSYDQLRRQRGEAQAKRPRPAPPRPAYTQERTGLRLFSAETLAVLLVALAAGLWLARLLG